MDLVNYAMYQAYWTYQMQKKLEVAKKSKEVKVQDVNPDLFD